MVSASSYLQPPLPPEPSQLWATPTKQEDDVVDELAGNEGKSWYPSTSPCTHARHTLHHLRTLEGMVMGCLPNTVRFRARPYPCLEPGIAG